MTRHNKICDGVADVARKFFIPSYMCGNTLIHPVHSIKEGKSHLTGSATNNPQDSRDASERKGNPLNREIWKRRTDIIHNMSVVNNDTLSYQNKSPEKSL